MENRVAYLLRRRAARLGACRQALDAWPRTKEELCAFYFAYIGFCVEHDFPTCEVLKRHFDGVMQRHHIFVEGVIDRHNPRRLSAGGSAHGTVRYDGFQVGWVYVRHNARLRVEASEHAMVFVYVHDRAEVEVVGRSAHPVRIFRRGGASVRMEGAARYAEAERTTPGGAARG